MRKRASQGNGQIIKRADGRWHTRVMDGYQDNGKPNIISLYGKSQKEVSAKRLELLDRLRKGLPPKDATITFGDWAQRYLNHYAKPSTEETTHAVYQTILRSHLTPAIGDIPLSKLRTGDIQKICSEKTTGGRIRGSGGLSSSTINHILALCKQILEQAVNEGLIVRNVAKQVKAPKLVQKEKQALSKEQAQDLLESLQSHRLYAAYFLAIHLGLRRGEIAGLTWDAINFEKKTISIHQAMRKTKTDSPKIARPKTSTSVRELPVSDECVSVLSEHKLRQEQEKMEARKNSGTYKDQKYVFCNEIGVPYYLDTYMLTLKKHMIKKGLPELSIHELRHTFATLAVGVQTDTKTLQQLLGHSTPHMALHYTHGSTKAREEAVGRLSKTLSEKPNEKIPEKQEEV